MQDFFYIVKIAVLGCAALYLITLLIKVLSTSEDIVEFFKILFGGIVILIFATALGVMMMASS